MKLDVELIKDMPACSKLNRPLHCKLTRGDSTPEQYAAMIDYIGFNPVKSNDEYTTYELGSNARVETLKREFLRFVKSDYGKKYILDIA